MAYKVLSGLLLVFHKSVAVLVGASRCPSNLIGTLWTLLIQLPLTLSISWILFKVWYITDSVQIQSPLTLFLNHVQSLPLEVSTPLCLATCGLCSKKKLAYYISATSFEATVYKQD